MSISRRWFVAMAIALLAVGASSARARVWYVDDDHPLDPAPGNPGVSNPLEDGSAEMPFDAIQEALDAADCFDEVVVAPGTYRGLGNFALRFRGKCIHLRSEAGPGQTIIDAAFGGRVFLFVEGETHDAIVEGFTITHGIAIGDGENFGGGLLIDSSSPTIRNCTVVENRASMFVATGGGMHLRNSSARIEHCRIIRNGTTGFLSGGAGVYMEASNPVISDCLIANNVGSLIEVSRGGGILLNTQSHAKIVRTIIESNTATFGGGILAQAGSSPLIDSCIVRHNEAESTAGILLQDFSSPIIRNTLVHDNTVINVQQGVVPGGGIDAYANTSPKIINSTIVNNFITGIGCFSGTPTITDSIIWNNEDDLRDCVSTYSCVGDGAPGTGNIAGPPQFAGAGDFRLDPTSPCVDAGDPEFEPAPGESDLDGHPRILCGRVDMGAYELGIGDYDCDGISSLADFAHWPDCETGPGSPSIGPGHDCGAFDFDADQDVDLRDFADLSAMPAGLAR